MWNGCLTDKGCPNPADFDGVNCLEMTPLMIPLMVKGGDLLIVTKVDIKQSSVRIKVKLQTDVLARTAVNLHPVLKIVRIPKNS